MIKVIRIAAMALVAAGVLSLLLGAFTYTREAYRLRLGGLALALEDRETVRIPIWVSLGAMAAGSLMLLLPRSKSVA